MSAPLASQGQPPATPFTFRATDGLELRGEVWGSGPIPLTFVHGSGLTVQSYAPAFAPLMERVTVQALNSRGHGGSAVPAAFPHWDAPLADLAALVRERMRPPVVLAGHSFGAGLSLRLAAEQPGLASGLLLLDPLVPWGRGQGWLPAGAGEDGELIARTRARRARWDNAAEAAESLRTRGIYRGWTDAAFAAFAASGIVPHPEGGATLACPPWLEVATYESRPGEIMFEWAERAGAPAVVLRGETSRECSVSGSEDLANCFPLATVLTVTGGHTFPQEAPDATAAALDLALDILERGVGGGEAATAPPAAGK